MTTTKTMTITEANRAYPNQHITAGEYIVVTTWTDDRGGKSDMLTAGGPTEDEALAEAQRLLDEGYISPDGDDTVYLVVRDEPEINDLSNRVLEEI